MLGRVRGVRTLHALGILLQSGSPAGFAKDHIPVSTEMEWPRTNYVKRQPIPYDLEALAEAAGNPEDERAIAFARDVEESFQTSTAIAMDVHTGNLEIYYKMIDVMDEAARTHFPAKTPDTGWKRAIREDNARVLQTRKELKEACDAERIAIEEVRLRTYAQTIPGTQTLRACLHTWRKAAEAQRVDREVGRIRKRRRKDKRDADLRELDAALEANNTSRVMDKARVIAGGGRGPRKRELRVPAAEAPNAEEFATHLAQTGPEGGCKARRVDTTDIRTGLVTVLPGGGYEKYDTSLHRRTNEERACANYDAAMRERQEDAGGREGQGLFECVATSSNDAYSRITTGNRHKRKRNRKRILGGYIAPAGTRMRGTIGIGDWGDGPWGKGQVTRVITKMKRRRMVPRGCRPKELWELAMKHTAGFADNVTELLNGMFCQNVCPIEWNNAQAAQLGKSNGKKGCKAIRLINLLDPIGKVFFTLIWQLSPESTCDFSYGFQRGKRREQAILIQK